jgi:MFS family permease
MSQNPSRAADIGFGRTDAKTPRLNRIGQSWPLLILLLVASSLTIMAGALVAPALPAMKQHFAATPDVEFLLILTITLPGLTIALFAPLAGLAADRIGRRRVLFAGLTLYGLAGAAPIFLDSLLAIICCRAILGAAVACTMTSATALIFDSWAGSERERAIGLQGVAVGVGGFCYPLLAGLLASFSWRMPFAVYPVALGLAIAAVALLQDTKPIRPAAQATADRLAARPIAVVLLLGFLAMMILYVIPVRGPFYLLELGYPAPILIALMTTIPSAVATVVGLNFAALRSSFGPQALTGLSFAFLAAGFATVSLVPNVYALFVGLALCGAGFGLNTPNLTSWLQMRVPPHQRGRAAGLFTMSVFLGQFCSTFVVAALARHTTYAGTFGLVALACLAVSVAGWSACIRVGAKGVRTA